MDHFARPGDELAIAAREHRLHRNFMGYTTRPATDMLGVGISAIGDTRGAYAQNHKKLASYYSALEAGRFPIERGYALSPDDLVRRHVIAELMCNFRVDARRVADTFGIDFRRYFAPELAAVRAPGGPADDGFVAVDNDGLEVTERGRLFVRTVCMLFDRYLPARQATPVFSRTV
jgi:oxygen-independent coproporphyrinogen-3 oxidase